MISTIKKFPGNREKSQGTPGNTREKPVFFNWFFPVFLPQNWNFYTKKAHIYKKNDKKKAITDDHQQEKAKKKRPRMTGERSPHNGDDNDGAHGVLTSVLLGNCQLSHTLIVSHPPPIVNHFFAFSLKKKQKKTGPSPMQNLERIFSHHPQVAMRCMHQSNLIG